MSKPSSRPPQEEYREGLPLLRASLAPDLCQLCRTCLYDMLAGGSWTSELWQASEYEEGSDMEFRLHKISFFLSSERLDCPMCRLLSDRIRQFKDVDTNEDVCIFVYKPLKADRMIDAFNVVVGSSRTMEFILWTVTEETTILFGKYHTSGPPMASGRHYPLVKSSMLDSGPIDTFLQTMIRKCQSHSLCNIRTANLPTRVIDVGNQGVRDPFIFETQLVPGQYVALSYCWGARSDHVTTMANLERRRHGLLLAELPLTLRDAILFCQRQSFRYLWIDALCIIQDSEVDWQREAEQMSTYYSGALFVLCATESEHSDGGLLFQRSVRVTEPSGSPIYVQHRDLDGAAPLRPLDGRAWTLQESLLPRAVFEMGFVDVTWKCATLTLEDTGEEGADRQPLAGLKDSNFNTEAQTELWEATVQSFCNRSLSFHKDKLAALAGVAALFQDRGWKTGRYLAGLWECDLYSSLLWEIAGSGGTSLDKNFATSDNFPSWTWARLIDGPIAHSYDHREITSPTPDGAVIDFASCWASDYSKAAQRVHGEIVLEGRLQLLSKVVPHGGKVTASWFDSWKFPVSDQYRERTHLNLESPITSSCWAIKFSTLLWFEILTDWFLILESAVVDGEETPTRFRRLGVASFPNTWDGANRGERRTIRLV